MYGLSILLTIVSMDLLSILLLPDTAAAVVKGSDSWNSGSIDSIVATVHSNTSYTEWPISAAHLVSPA